MVEHERRSAGIGRRVRHQLVNVVAKIVRFAGTLAAVLLTAQVLLAVGGANPENPIARFVANAAAPVALGFSDLFTPGDPKLRVLINYGIAAIFWLVVTSIVVRLIRSVG